MASASTSTAYLAPLNVSFDDPSPVAWPATYTLTSIGDYPFGPPQDETIEVYVERRYLECLWMPEILEPLSAFVPSLQRVTPPKEWTPSSGPHPLHAVLDEHLLDLVDLHKKYRKTIPALLEKEGDAQDAEEACIWYAWSSAQPSEEQKAGEGVNEEKWAKDWLHEAEKREYLIQILLRMLKLTLPPPPAPKRKRSKNKVAEEYSPYAETVAGLEMLVDRIGIIQQTATSALKKDQEKALGKSNANERDWAAIFCEDVLKPLFEESLPEHYETIRYHCLPPASRDPSPALSESSQIDMPTSQSQSQPHQPARSLSRATSTSSRAGSLSTRSISRSSVSRNDPRQSQSQSRSRSGSVEDDPILDRAKSRSRSRSVSFAARSAGGIRATVQRPGVRPKGGKAKVKQASGSLLGLGKPTRITAPEPARAPTTGPTLLVAETPQKPSRTIGREVSITGASLMQRFQDSQSQSLARSQSQRKVSMDKSGLEEFMVSSPERLRDDFNFGDMVLETPKK